MQQSFHRGKSKRLSKQEKKLHKRRQAVEPIIGHLKQDHRMNRCHLKTAVGDASHAVLCAADYTIKWLLRMIAKKRLGLGAVAFFTPVDGVGVAADGLSGSLWPPYRPSTGAGCLRLGTVIQKNAAIEPVDAVLNKSGTAI